MGKGSHFTGQPVYSQVIKLLDRSEILKISRSVKDSEAYVKKFDGYQHLIVMLFGVLKHFDSLRELEIGMKAEANKLQHLGLNYIVRRSTLAEAKVFEEKKKPVVLLTNNMELSVEDISEIYRLRWAIEMLYKQLKQNFPLHFFYGDSVNAIQIQTWVVLIANLLITVLSRSIKRQCAFSQVVTMVRLTLMYYMDFVSFMENPDKNWEEIQERAAGQPPPEPSFFD